MLSQEWQWVNSWWLHLNKFEHYVSRAIAPGFMADQMRLPPGFQVLTEFFPFSNPDQTQLITYSHLTELPIQGPTNLDPDSLKKFFIPSLLRYQVLLTNLWFCSYIHEHTAFKADRLNLWKVNKTKKEQFTPELLWKWILAQVAFAYSNYTSFGDAWKVKSTCRGLLGMSPSSFLVNCFRQ